jgi:hypothetical protein
MLALNHRTPRTDVWKVFALHLHKCLSASLTSVALRFVVFALFGLVVPTSRLLAVDYFYQSGDATLLANWNTILAGGGATPANFTTAADRFLVPSGRTAIITSNLSLGASVILQVQTGGSFDGQTFAVIGAGDFDLQTGAVLITAHPSGVNGGVVQVTGTRTFNATASYTFNAAAATQTSGFVIGTPITAAQSITVNNQLAGTAGALQMDNGVTLSGTLTVQRGTFDCGAQNHAFNGGANTVVVSPGTIFLRRTGNVTAAAGTFLYQTGTPNAQLQYDATGAVVTDGELPASMPGDVQIILNTTLQLNSAKTINGALTVNGTLDCIGFTLTQNGAFTANATAIIDIKAGSLVWNGNITFVAGSQFQDNSGGGGASLTLAGTGTITGEFLWQGGANNLGSLILNRAGATLTSAIALSLTNLLSL